MRENKRKQLFAEHGKFDFTLGAKHAIVVYEVLTLKFLLIFHLVKL
jgi:hypothetical protein